MDGEERKQRRKQVGSKQSRNHFLLNKTVQTTITLRDKKLYTLLPLGIGFFLYADKLYFHFFASLPKFVYYQLPDFLWLFSFLNLITIIWKFNTVSYLYLVALLLLAILLEVFQKWKVIAGTFDWLDILAYLIAFLFSILIIKSLQLKSQKHD